MLAAHWWKPSSAAAELQDLAVDAGWRGERPAGNHEAEVDGELALPPARRWRTRAGPPASSVALEHELSRHEPAPRVEQPGEQLGGHAVGRVGHHVERAARQAQVGGVGPHHRDPVAELVAQGPGPCRVALDRDDARPSVEQRPRERAKASADIEHQIAAADTGGVDQALSPGVVELVPSPVLPWLSHGSAPSS